MNVLLVYAHPNPQSFNAAIKQTLVDSLSDAGHSVRVRDLYAQNFNPVLSATDIEQMMAGTVPADIQTEQDHVRWAQSLVFIYPLWWFDRPAILKGWVDRVFSNGFAFSYGTEGLKGLLSHRALAIQTTGGPRELFTGDAAQWIEAPMLHGTMGFCGMQAKMLTLFGVPGADDATRAAYLAQAKQAVLDMVAG